MFEIARFNMSPKFSLVIATYEGLDLLKATLESVWAQSFHSYEVIVVDDEALPQALLTIFWVSAIASQLSSNEMRAQVLPGTLVPKWQLVSMLRFSIVMTSCFPGHSPRTLLRLTAPIRSRPSLSGSVLSSAICKR